MRGGGEGEEEGEREGVITLTQDINNMGDVLTF